MNTRGLLSAICMVSILAGFTQISAAPIRFDQVIQVISPEPGASSTGAFSHLAVAGDNSLFIGDDDDDTKGKKKDPQTQDGRVITETKTDIVRDDVCDCEEVRNEERGFPKWALLGLAAIPIAFIIIHHHHETPTPTATLPPPPATGTPTPSVTPTPTPTMTPPMTPTPTPPQPVPEPMTILLFGTGLASIGFAARRRFGKKDSDGEEEESE